MKIKMADDPGAYYAWKQQVEQDSTAKREIARLRAIARFAYIPPPPPKPGIQKRLNTLWYAFKWHPWIRPLHTGSSEGLRRVSVKLFGRTYAAWIGINLRHSARWGPRRFEIQLATYGPSSTEPTWSGSFSYEKPFHTFHVTPLSKSKYNHKE